MFILPPEGNGYKQCNINLNYRHKDITHNRGPMSVVSSLIIEVSGRSFLTELLQTRIACILHYMFCLFLCFIGEYYIHISIPVRSKCNAIVRISTIIIKNTCTIRLNITLYQL